MHKKVRKKIYSLRRFVNFDLTLSGFGDKEVGGIDDGENNDEDQDPEVKVLTRSIEKEGFDAILKELEHSFAQLAKDLKNENAAEEETSRT